MTSAKYKALKLISQIFILIGIINLMFPCNTSGEQRFTVQVAASKSPLDIDYFSKRHQLSDSITEIKSPDWNRYVVGSFESLREASRYANEIALQNGITDAFPRDVELIPKNSPPEPKTDSTFQSKVAAPVADSTSFPTEKTVPGTRSDSTTLKSKNGSNTWLIRLVGDKNILEVKRDLIIYGNKHFPLFIRKFYIRVIEKIYAYPIVLFFTLLIFIFILNIILALFVLYYSNQQKNRKERYIRIYSNLYETVLRSYLFGELDWKKTLIKLKKINKPWNRKILTSVLFNFQENLRGEMDTQIPEIFVKTGLHQDAIKSIKSSNIFSKVQGIREITNLYPEGAVDIIQGYINDPNDLVRAEAQISYIRLHPDHPFEFFRSLTRPFTRWTQLSAFYHFRLYQLPVPSFIDYLDSENSNIRNFCLRMIIFFQQLENASGIIKMLRSPIEQTRFLSIKAINDLRLEEGKEQIKIIYPDETGTNRLEIIKALRNVGTAEDFDFLETIIQTGSVSEKTEACRSMYFMNKEGIERIGQLNLHSNFEIERYVAHVTDLRN